MDIKKNSSLILGISIPIFMILFVTGSIYIPSLFAPDPQYDFVYVMGDNDSYYGYQYTVEDGKLVKNDIQVPSNFYRPQQKVYLFLHDIETNESKEVSFEEAQSFRIDSKTMSPDGFEVTHGSRGEGIPPLFFGSYTDYNSVYLKGHGVSKKLNLGMERDYYNFRFVGWVLK